MLEDPNIPILNDSPRHPLDNPCAICGARPAAFVVQSRNGAYSIGVCSVECMENEPEIDWSALDENDDATEDSMNDAIMSAQLTEWREVIAICNELLTLIKARNAGWFLSNVEILLHDEIQVAERRIGRYELKLAAPPSDAGPGENGA